jgi:bifunctional enzyme CysN/CysC
VILLFCGIPGSGKTTIADLLAARLSTLTRAKVLSSDRLKSPVYRRIFKTLESERGEEEFLLLDATFYKKEWRERVAALGGAERVVTIFLDCPREVAVKRNRERRPNITERALHIVYYKMEPPENPDLRIATSTTTAEAAAERIYEWINSNKAKVESKKAKVKEPVFF